jgi:hypothetical protein
MVVMAVREGGFDFHDVVSMPLPNLVALCKQITRSVYREQYEWAWSNFVSSQCDQKALKELTKPWKKVAGIK